MSKIKEALWNDYNNASKELEGLEVKSEEHKMLLEERDKLRNELIKLEQIEMETKIKTTQIQAEDEREKIRNQITIGTFVITTGVSIYTIAKTFKFDQVATVTSTLGRNILNGVVPKMFKRQ